MAVKAGVRGFLTGLLSNAVWDSAKQIVQGPLVVSSGAALWEYLRHRSVDWWGIFGLFLLTFLVFFGLQRKPGKTVPSMSMSQATARRVEMERDRYQATMLSFFAERAFYLYGSLEDIWHRWDNAGEKLIHPLGEHYDLKNFDADHVKRLTKALEDFEALYREHLSLLEEYTPDFESKLPILPSEVEYHILRTDLQEHANLLKYESNFRWEKVRENAKTSL